MATIKASLKTPNEENSVIWLTLSDGREVNIKVYSGITIKSKHWSKKNTCVLSANPDAVSINKFIKELQSQVLTIYLTAKGKGIQPDAKFIRQALDDLRKPEEPEQEKPAFWKSWESYLLSKKHTFKPRSLVKLSSLEKHLKSFEKHSKILLDVDKITSRTLESLQEYFYHIKDLNTQTTAKYIEIVKMFLKWAVENDLTLNTDWKKFKVIHQKDTLKIILTDAELEKIRSVDLKEKNYLKNVRELLILSCYTGLRHSDYSRIKAEHLKTDGDGTPTLLIRQEKTGDFVEVPLTPEAETIVRKIISKEIHNITNQRMNFYLKELCQIAGIDEPFEVHIFKGKISKVEIKPKYELVSTHIGRRTFATRLLLRGIPAQTVMLFTGHKDYKSFSKYVNIPKAAQMKAVKNALLN